jgi:hypothetical protein
VPVRADDLIFTTSFQSSSSPIFINGSSENRFPP